MSDTELDKIHIRDLTVRCIIGIYDEERREKQDVTINITMLVDLRRAGQTDDIRHTIDYKGIKKAVLAMAEVSSFFLLERMAERIADICLNDRLVTAVIVRVAKPGALRFARTVEVEIMRHRTEGSHIRRNRR